MEASSPFCQFGQAPLPASVLHAQRGRGIRYWPRRKRRVGLRLIVLVGHSDGGWALRAPGWQCDATRQQPGGVWGQGRRDSGARRRWTGYL